MLYRLPEDMQWHIWRLYYNRYVLSELRAECERRDATMIQNYVRVLIDKVLSDVVNTF
jgi:hypothetical protein